MQFLKNGGSHGGCRYSCSWCPSKPYMNWVLPPALIAAQQLTAASKHRNQQPRTIIFLQQQNSANIYTVKTRQTSRARLQERIVRHVTPQSHEVGLPCLVVCCGAQNDHKINCLKKTDLLELESRSWLCSRGTKFLENSTNNKK